MERKLVCSAHDDDGVLGMGGLIARFVEQGDEVRVLIFTSGHNSHRLCLGITENPTPDQLAEMRRQEAKIAYGLLGVPDSCLTHWRDYPEAESVLEQKRSEIIQRLGSLVGGFSIDRVYFHQRDAHPDHCFVNDVVLEVLAGQQGRCQGYQFSIWTRELAEGRNETDISLIPPLSTTSQHTDITQWLALKRKALHAFRSQVNVWPYPEWNPQEKPVLEAEFLQHFLRGQETITPVE